MLSHDIMTPLWNARTLRKPLFKTMMATSGPRHYNSLQEESILRSRTKQAASSKQPTATQEFCSHAVNKFRGNKSLGCMNPNFGATNKIKTELDYYMKSEVFPMETLHNFSHCCSILPRGSRPQSLKQRDRKPRAWLMLQFVMQSTRTTSGSD